MALIGYCRVSRADGSQVTDLQRDALIAAGVEPSAIYEDQASGKRDDRPGLESCLKALRPGDVLVCWKLDRLGRSLRHLVEVVDQLSRRQIGLKVLSGAPIDTTSAAGKLVFAIFAGLAEFEHALIVERTMAGLAAARARGRFGGRPRKMTRAKLKLAQSAMADRNTDVGQLAKDLGVTRQTIYRHIGPNGKLRPEGERLLKHETRTNGADRGRAHGRNGAAEHGRVGPGPQRQGRV